MLPNPGSVAGREVFLFLVAYRCRLVPTLPGDAQEGVSYQPMAIGWQPTTPYGPTSRVLVDSRRLIAQSGWTTT